MSLNDAAARGFTRGADDYEAVRPGYPATAVDLLIEKLPITPRTRLCDLGAGTGKLTRALLRTGADIIAIEPVAAMRRKLAITCPDVETLDGTAEALPLVDASVDAVTVAQAFHWFDVGAALAEVHRILRARGGLALVWNVRDESVPWVRDFGRLLDRAAGGKPYDGDADVAELVASSGLFTPVEQASFPNPVPADVTSLVQRAASTSYISALPDDRRGEALEEVRQLAETHPGLSGRQEFDFPHTTVVFWCHRTS
jgi:SAM-dependent methyltransferase